MTAAQWGGSLTRRAWPLVVAIVIALASAAPASATTFTQAAHSGSWYGATSTASGGGGSFEDLPLSTSAGELVCASAWVRTQYPATGASGSLVVWLINGSASDGGQAI